MNPQITTRYFVRSWDKNRSIPREEEFFGPLAQEAAERTGKYLRALHSDQYSEVTLVVRTERLTAREETRRL